MNRDRVAGTFLFIALMGAIWGQIALPPLRNIGGVIWAAILSIMLLLWYIADGAFLKWKEARDTQESLEKHLQSLSQSFQSQSNNALLQSRATINIERGTPEFEYDENVDSITDNGDGSFTLNWGRDYADDKYWLQPQTRNGLVEVIRKQPGSATIVFKRYDGTPSSTGIFIDVQASGRPASASILPQPLADDFPRFITPPKSN